MLNIRRLERRGAWIALLLQSGAIFPLVLAPEGVFTGTARLFLQMLNLPVLLFACSVLALRPGQTLVVLRHNLDLAVLMMLPLLSAIWSISVSNSVTSAAAVLTSFLLGIALAILFPPRQLLLLVAAVVGPVALLSLLFAMALPALGWSEDGTLRGVFTHKN